MSTSLAAAPDSLHLDAVLADHDATRLELEVVTGPAYLAYRVARDLDLLRVHTPLMDAAMWARGVPDQLRLRRRGGPAPAPLAPLRVADLFDGPPAPGPLEAWMGLAEEPGRELVFGAVGRFWTPSIEWRRIEAGSFATFAEPGWARIAASFTVLPFGAERSIVAYEARTAATDAASRAGFLRYWRLVSPFVGVVMRATLRQIAVDVVAAREA